MSKPILYGHIVAGPPGSGKTTYCRGIHEFMKAANPPRVVELVNLDPANDFVPYTSTIDIRDLVILDEVMNEMKLGPNGGMIYCMDFLLENIEWLVDQILNRVEVGADAEEPYTPYFVFDLPGQVELYTHSSSVKDMVDKLCKLIDFRLAVVHLVEATHCSDASQFMSSVLLSLSSMMRLELPHLNVLSKIDLADPDGALMILVEQDEEAVDANYLMSFLTGSNFLPGQQDEKVTQQHQSQIGSKFMVRNAKLQQALQDLLEDYSLVAFTPLNIQDQNSVARLVVLIDKCIGYH